MCGIWFYIQPKDSSHLKLSEACDAVQKRGPDRSISRNLTFGNFEIFLTFHRLAIMDLSPAGDQPFYLKNDKQEEIYLVCNGEIYGYKNLVRQFDLGNVLTSGSDCEVLIHLYDKLGLGGLYDILTTRDDVSGEFAMVILHFKHNILEINYMRDFCGKRPLYYSEYYTNDGYDSFHTEFNSLCLTSQLCGIPFPEYIYKKSGQIKGSTYGTYIIRNDSFCIEKLSEYTENLRKIPITIFDEKEACDKIYSTFMRIVEDQMAADKKKVYALSGGLDSSSNVCCSNYINKKNNVDERLNTICTSLEGGTDEKYARIIATHVNSNHIHALCTEEEYIDCCENVITSVIESYDITSNRASVPQLILAKKIKEMTDCKVVIVGDYADEVCGGYNETKYAPTVEDFEERIYELTEEIIYFDGTRVDRCNGHNGLESRMPFGDHRFIKLYLSIDPELRRPRNSCEKYLFRKAFDGKGIIPQEVLWRPKEAFSDGVSPEKRSWYKVIYDYFDNKYTDKDLEDGKKFGINTPYTKESLHYRLKFNEKYSDSQSNVIPKFWLPKWGNVKEPSARVLDVYKTSDN